MFNFEFLLFLLIFAFRPGSVIVYFILYFKTAVTPEKGIENLRVAISSDGTFGDFQAEDLVLLSDESTTSTTPTGTKENTTSNTTTGVKRVGVRNNSFLSPM